MGLNPATSSGPVVAPAPKGILDPSTGRPVGANDPFAQQPDPKTANTIGYFAPAMALIVRAPSRMHTSITGGIIGGNPGIIGGNPGIRR